MISLTPNSLEYIRKFREEAGKPAAGLRIAVVGGGCSGLSYKLDFEEMHRDDDNIFQCEDVFIFVDPKSLLFVDGLILDYTSGLNGTGFNFHNPNADKFCGCGTSFSV